MTRTKEILDIFVIIAGCNLIIEQRDGNMLIRSFPGIEVLQWLFKADRVSLSNSLTVCIHSETSTAIQMQKQASKQQHVVSCHGPH